MELYCDVLPVFGFNSAKNQLNLNNSCLQPIHVNERDIEHTVVNKSNQFISLKFGDFRLLDILNFFESQQVLIFS